MDDIGNEIIISRKDVEGNKACFTVLGDLRQTNGWELAEALLREIESGQSTKIEVDLSKLHYIDSSGIGTLMTCFQKAKEIWGNTDGLLFRVNSPMAKKLRFAKVDKILNIEEVA